MFNTSNILLLGHQPQLPLQPSGQAKTFVRTLDTNWG